MRASPVTVESKAGADALQHRPLLWFTIRRCVDVSFPSLAHDRSSRIVMTWQQGESQVRVLAIGLLSLLAGVGLPGCECGGENYASDCLVNASNEEEVVEPDEDSAAVSFRNQMVDPSASSANDTALDLFVNTESQPLFEGTEYSDAGSVRSARIELDQSSQSVAFDLRASATDLSLISNQSASLRTETSYTLVAMGDLGDSSTHNLAVLRHLDRSPPGGRVSMRFVNTLAATVTPLDVIVDGDLEVAGLEYGDDSDYIELQPDGGVIEVELRDLQDDVVATADCDVDDGLTYIAVLAYESFNALDDNDIRLYCRSQ
jgi:hypothetical protein